MERKIALNELTDSDMPLFKNWLSMPHVAKWYHNPLDWIDEVERKNSDFCWLHHFIVEYNGQPVGFCQYYEYTNSGETWHGNTEINGTYSIDYLIGEVSCLTIGIGKAMVKALIEKIKLEENALRIIVQPEPENIASCNTLLSNGFKFDEFNKFYILDL